MRTSALFDAKKFGFFKIYGVSAQIKRVEPVRTFSDKGGRGHFSPFCVDVFYDGPLLNLVVISWNSLTFQSIISPGKIILKKRKNALSINIHLRFFDVRIAITVEAGVNFDIISSRLLLSLGWD